MAQAAVASAPMTRTPGKPKKGKPYRMHVVLPGELVELVDKFAADVGPFQPTRTRTDAIRDLLIAGLKTHGLIK